MRRTDQEFKEEILRRSDTYQRRRAKRRKKILGGALCLCICCTALIMVAPKASVARDAAAPGTAMITAGVGEALLTQQENASAECCGEEPILQVQWKDETFTLDSADADVIMECLSGEWIPAAANCLVDYTLFIDGACYSYHSDCGTFQNESGQSLTLKEDDRLMINQILKRN